MVDSILNHYFDHIYVVNLKFKIADRLIITKHLNEHGVDFEIFEATNGYKGEPFAKFEEYQKRDLGKFKRYPEYSKKEKQHGHSYIESPGAFGYIYTYLGILEDAQKHRYKRFLILEDDIILSNTFEDEFKNFIQNVNEDWKILLLGASQYGWGSVDIKRSKKEGFYFPRMMDTKGSYAIAFDSSIIDELIEAESAFEAPFDHLPMGELYERYLEKCFVAYPNIVMPDVSESTIRDKRCQYTHSKLMQWPLANFDYPLTKPSISIIITDKNNLKYYSSFSNSKDLPFTLKLFFNSSDGLRPLHNLELLNAKENKILPFDRNSYLPDSDYSVIVDEEDTLIESDIVKFIEYKLNIQEKNITALKEIIPQIHEIRKEKVSVIIPTYKRPENLKNALTSVVTQDYQDIEIIVVSDNGNDSKFIDETREIISSFNGQNDHCNIILLEHSVNRNGAAARNTGILHSTGEYICFLDDDDIYLPGRLSNSIKKLKTTNKTTAAVYCGFLGWNSKKNDLNRYKTGDLTLDLLLLDYKKHYLHTNTATYRREAILNINGFDESYRRHQDLEINLRYFERYKIEAIKECLVHLRPILPDNNNTLQDLSMWKLKQKFLNQFSYTIRTYDNNTVRSIYISHWAEVKKYISDMNTFTNQVSNASSEGLLYILYDIEPTLVNKKTIYKLLMTKSTLLKTKLKNTLAYQKLRLIYHKYR